MPRCVVTLIAVFIALASMAPAQAPAQGPAQERPPASVQPDQLFRSATASLAAKKFPEAEAAFRRLYAAEPDNLRGLAGVIQVYLAQGKEDDALQLLDAETAKPPVRPDLLVVAGDTAMRVNKYDQAIARFQQALAALGAGNKLTGSANALPAPVLMPEGAAGVYFRLSDAYYRKGDKGDAKSALEAIRHAKELLPNDPAVLWSLAIQLDAAGQKKEALESYQTVITADPRNALALNNAAYLMAETGGDLYEALRYAQRAELLAPTLTPITDTIGWVKLKLGWVDDALATFVRLVMNEPGNLNYRAHFIAAIEKSGDHSKKIVDLVAALKKEPSPENTAQLRAILNSGK